MNFYLKILTTMVVYIFTTTILIKDTYASETCVPLNKVSIEELNKSISKLQNNLKVLSVNKSPIKKIYEVIIRNEDNKKESLIYIDCSLKHLISGNIVDIGSRVNITEKRFKELEKDYILKIKKLQLEKMLGSKKVKKIKEMFGNNWFRYFDIVKLENLPTEHVIVLGNQKANNNIYLITSYHCEPCNKIHKEIMKLLQKRKDIKITVILLGYFGKDLMIHTFCINNKNKQKEFFLNYFKKSYFEDNLKKCDELESYSEKVIQTISNKTNIQNFPVLIFPSGIYFIGTISHEKLIKLFEILKN